MNNKILKTHRDFKIPICNNNENAARKITPNVLIGLISMYKVFCMQYVHTGCKNYTEGMFHVF